MALPANEDLMSSLGALFLLVAAAVALVYPVLPMGHSAVVVHNTFAVRWTVAATAMVLVVAQQCY